MIVCDEGVLSEEQKKNIVRTLLMEYTDDEISEWEDILAFDLLIHIDQGGMAHISYYSEMSCITDENQIIKRHTIESPIEYACLICTDAERLYTLKTLDWIYMDLAKELSTDYKKLPFIEASLDDLKIYKENLTEVLNNLSDLYRRYKDITEVLPTKIDISFLNKYQYKDSFIEAMNRHDYYYKVEKSVDRIELVRTGKINDRLESKVQSIVSESIN